VILDSLENLMEGRTSFMIAHRLSTVRHADQILVMHDGRIVERGTHDELDGLGGVYTQLHKAQTRERKRPQGAQRREQAPEPILIEATAPATDQAQEPTPKRQGNGQNPWRQIS
jgi:ABC-type multidrug transport system ATPase subunit